MIFRKTAQAGRPPFIHFFAATLLLTAILSLLFAWHILDSFQHSRRIQSIDLRLLALSWTVFHREEILTMSVHMAAATGDSKWEEEYRSFEPKVSSSIKEMEELHSKEYVEECIEQIGALHRRMSALEERTLEMTRWGELDGASRELSSNEYEKLRTAFTKAIDRTMSSVEARMESTLEHQGTQALHMTILTAVTLPILILSWHFVLRTIRKYLSDRNRAESALRISEAEYRELVQSANSIILRMDREGRVEFLNTFGLRFFGYSEEEIFGRSVVGTIVPEQESSGRNLNALIRKLLADPDSFSTNENENMRKSGETVWVTWTNKAVRDEQGGIVGVLSIGNDITARRQAEKALELDEARFEALFELSRMTERSTAEISDFALEKLVLMTESEMGFLGFLNEDESVLITNTWSSEAMGHCAMKEYAIPFTVSGGGIWTEPIRERKPFIINDYDAPHPSKRGLPEDHTPLKRFMAVPVFEGDHIVAIAAVANKCKDYDSTDIRQLTLFLDGVWKLVEHKRAQEALRKSEERYRTLVETMNEGLVAQDENRLLVYVNDRFCKMLGYTKEALIGGSLPELFDEASRQIYEAQMTQRRQGISSSYEATMLRLDGSKLSVIISAAPVLDEQGVFRGSIGTITDITERKRSEEALRVYAQKLEQSNRELQEFTYAGSHHLQEPLRKIQTFSNLLMHKHSSALNEQALDYLKRMNCSAQRAQLQIEALLDYSHLAARSKGSYSRVSLQRVAQATLECFSDAIEAGEALVEIGELCEIEADYDQMALLFRSLIDNALKFRGIEVPRVRISTRIVDGSCEISIEDNGMGFDEKYLPELFKPFHKLHSGSAVGGAGIGLSICRKIAERHGGSITAKSTPGKGSTFIVVLPLRRND